MTQEFPIRMQHPALAGESINSGYVARREDDGSVVMEQRKSNGDHMTVVSRQTFSPDQWASIVAAMAHGGQPVCDAACAYEKALVDRHGALAAIPADDARTRVAATLPIPAYVSPPQVAAALKAHLGK